MDQFMHATECSFEFLLLLLLSTVNRTNPSINYTILLVVRPCYCWLLVGCLGVYCGGSIDRMVGGRAIRSQRERRRHA